MDVSIIIATYGDAEWIDIANTYAVPSAMQLDAPIIRVHGGDSLAESRNTAASLANTEWLCFLDGDDKLDINYLNDMSNYSGELLAPRLIFVDNGLEREPFNLAERNMSNNNQCPIGTLIRKSTFDKIGGFWNEPIYEDWSLFRRAWLLGADIVHTNAKYYSYDVGNRNDQNFPGAIENIMLSHVLWLQEVGE